MLRTFSLVGFIVGLVVAILIAFVAPGILSFPHCRLVYGLVAILVWIALTFRWPGGPGTTI